MEQPHFTSEADSTHLPEVIDSYHPDAIAIFSGGIVRRERFGHDYYSTTAYKDSGMGGKARVHAASYLAQTNPEIPLLTLSSVDPHAPSHAVIMREELMRKGVDEQTIITAPKPHNTLTEVIETYQQAQEHGWDTIMVISNEYHGDRIKYMYDHVHELVSLNQLLLPGNELRAEFIAAEDILWNISPHYRKVISEWRNSPAYQARVEQELQGMEDLRNGKYIFTTKEEALLWERKWEQKIAEIKR